MNLRIIFTVVAIIFGLLVVGSIIYALIPRATVVFAVAPEEVTVVINGSSQRVTTGQEVTVSPGTLTIKVSRDEFDSYSQTIDIKNGEKREILYALNPLTDGARDLLKTDKSQRILERIGGLKAAEGAAQVVDTYPILEALPINDKFYKIAVCSSRLYPDDTSKIAICVNLYDMAAKSSAIYDIERRGYVLSDYEIVYVDATYTTANEEAGE